MVDLFCEILMHAIWMVSAYWLGYLLGQQRAFRDMMKNDAEDFKKKVDEAKEKIKNL